MLDKNGKPYKLFSAPNPLVTKQVRLPENELVFHNFKTKPKIVNLNLKKNETIVNVPESSQEPKFIEPVVEKLPEPKFVEPIIEKPPEPVKQIIEPELEVASEPLIDPEIPQEGIVLVHCHPIVEKEVKDDFYGEVRIKTSFGNKFIFEAYIVESNDIEICLYTKQKNIKVGSILYPSKYKDGDRLEMLRWWKVSSIKQQDDEFLIFGQATTEIRSF